MQPSHTVDVFIDQPQPSHAHYFHLGDNFMDFERAFEMSDSAKGYLTRGTIAYDMAQLMHTAYIEGEAIALSTLVELWSNHPRRQSPRTMTNAYAKVMPGNAVSTSYVARVNAVLDAWCKANDFALPERLVGSGLYELRWMPV